MKIGVIISTYNNPEWLQKTLWGYMYQTVMPYEVVIADDGSTVETRALIDAISKEAPFVVKHVWHEDDGFRKTTIVNRAIVAAESDYLIFADQDCIPRYDLVEVHAKFAEKGYFLSAGHFKLSMEISKAITREDISTRRVFSAKWLVSRGVKRSFKYTKLTTSKAFAAFMNFVTPTKATWNGGTSSGWRDDLLAVNGYNETMRYGGEDRELGERLINYGLRSKQIRYSAICLHLDHGRPYKHIEEIKRNDQIRANTRKNKVTFTPDGIVKK